MKGRFLPGLALVAVLRVAVAAPLPGEVVTQIGQVAAVPADERKVPGYAGAWRQAASQAKVIERIEELESRRSKACSNLIVIDTVQAAPDLIETRPRRVHHALERWSVQACGVLRHYDVWYSFEASSSQLKVSESSATDFQAELDPPLRRLQELAAGRSADESAGKLRWLNLPLPSDSVPAANSAGARGWLADFVPLGDSPREWTQLIGVQGLPRVSSPGQARALLEGMQQARQARCGVPAGPVDSLPREGDGASGETVQTYLVCPQVPDTNYAEMAVVKAIEGPDYVYVVQRAWRLPAGDAERLKADSENPRAAAEAFLAQVHLCNPAGDRQRCPAPYPR
ncbi:MAG: hypothetical protein JSS57_01390 [Proteobacteria bacterium]|nr:hypothetical protein [Pseudomonadota bacterium]